MPVPVDTETVVEAILEGLLLRRKPGTEEQLLLGFEEYFRPRKEDLFTTWEASAEHEKRSRTMFAQEGLSASVDEVQRELLETRKAIGSNIDVAAFTKDALLAHGAVVNENGVVKWIARDPPWVEGCTDAGPSSMVRFEPPPRPASCCSLVPTLWSKASQDMFSTSTHPKVTSIARRCGVIRTRAVSRRTTVLLLRLRYHIVTRRGTEEQPLLAEDCQAVAFAGSPSSPTWLDREVAEGLMRTTPDANIHPDQAAEFIRKVNDEFPALEPHLREVAIQRGEALLEAHTRVRTATRMRDVRHRVEPQLPPDVLGIYVYLPVVQVN